MAWLPGKVDRMHLPPFLSSLAGMRQKMLDNRHKLVYRQRKRFQSAFPSGLMRLAELVVGRATPKWREPAACGGIS